MKTFYTALLKTILFICIVAAGTLIILAMVITVGYLINNDYGIHAALGFIILVFIFNYFHERKQQTEPYNERQ